VTTAWLERFVEEGAFFGYFLCTSKESNSLKAKALGWRAGAFVVQRWTKIKFVSP
jgi:hypothetical protein